MCKMEEVILNSKNMKRVFVLCLMTLCVHLVRGQFSGQGSGTKDDPFLISTALNVWEIRNFQGLEKKFKLINDIDMSELIADTDGDAGWSPIPNFCGELDGNGYTISGLFINRPYTDNIGFFGVLGYGANVHHLTLVYSGDIIGQNYVGGLCGSCDRTYQSNPKRRRIECCKIKAKSIRGADYESGASAVGGLCGSLSGYLNYDTNKKTFDRSYVIQCVVDASQIYGNGLIGGGELNYIANNNVRANIITGSYVGGIVGSDSGSEIFNNLFEGIKINASKGSGGIFYNAGKYNYDYEGYVRSNVVICDSIISTYGGNDCIGRIGAYTDGSVSISSPTDQKANKAYSKIVLKKGEDCYLATDDVLNGYGVGNILLKSASMYEGMGWDMDNVWTIDEGNSYPRLRWEVENELNKSPLSITNNNVEVEDNAILTFDAEKVTTNVGGGITYTYYQCIPDEPIISNCSSSTQQVTVTISSEDYSHLKWVGIDGNDADMMDISETRSCQLGKGESTPLKLHAVFADQDFGSYTATIKVSCNNLTRTFQIRFLYENPNRPICPTPDIDYADGTLVFSCGAEGKPEYRVSITSPDANTYVVDNELKLDRIYNIEVYATAEGYLASESTKLILCWIDSKIIDEDDSSIKEECLPIQIRKNNGTITITGIAKNTLVSAYSLSGILLDSATIQAETVTLNLPTSVDVMILKIGDKSIKITF